MSRAAYDELVAHLTNTPLAVVEWDHQARVRRWSGSAEAMFGWTAAEVLGRTVEELNFVCGDDAERVRAVIGDLLGQRVPGNVCRNRNRHKSGRVVTCLWHNSAHLDGDGKLVSVLSFAQDLTEQSVIQEQLAISDERLKSSLRFAGMLSWDFDLASRSMYYSQDVREFFGVPNLPAGADLEFGMAHPDDRARVLEEVRVASRSFREFRIEYRGTDPDAEGRTRWFSTRGSFVAAPDGRVVRCMGVTADISERKRSERERAALDGELREARHLESLGLLAGGIAHDFNNLLTIILGNAGVVKLIAGPDAALARNLGEIEAACGRAADLCSQITAYAGVGRLQSAEFDVGAMLRDSRESLEVAAGQEAKLECHFEARPCPVVGEARQLGQAVVNLLANAAEAMAGRSGTIELRTERLTFEQPPAGFSPGLPAGSYIGIRVADTGCGMEESVRARAFGASFSTKFPGRGLGLAAVYGIVRDHRGGARIESRPGLGTTVQLLLPACRDPLPVASEPRAISVASDADPILVVDDDPNIRELICSVLEDAGHTVAAAANGTDALALFAEHPGRFRLAIVDLMMPGLAGQDVIHRMRLLRPGFPAVVVSGYSAREVPADLLASGPTLILPKPFRLERLTETVEAITSAARPV